jgi:hypothetical protein
VVILILSSCSPLDTDFDGRDVRFYVGWGTRFEFTPPPPPPPPPASPPFVFILSLIREKQPEYSLPAYLNLHQLLR